MIAGLNWILVEELEEKNSFSLPTEIKPKQLKVTSVGTAGEGLVDPNLKDGCLVIIEPQGKGLRLDEKTVAYRRTQIVAII